MPDGSDEDPGAAADLSAAAQTRGGASTQDRLFELARAW
jgi:hypothetical protein